MGLQSSTVGPWQTPPSGITARIRSDGTLSFKEPELLKDVKPSPVVFTPIDGQRGLAYAERPQPGKVALGVRGTFDLHDMAMRVLGKDPDAYAKGKYAEATRETRLGMAQKALESQKQDALFNLKGRLERIRKDPSMTVEQLRYVIFALWDELAEDPSADAARATIMVFIRRTFPERSRDAYSFAELHTLNQKRSSRSAFTPYGDESRAGEVGSAKLDGGPPPSTVARP
jgi:hypothetical protein